MNSSTKKIHKYLKNCVISFLNKIRHRAILANDGVALLFVVQLVAIEMNFINSVSLNCWVVWYSSSLCSRNWRTFHWVLLKHTLIFRLMNIEKWVFVHIFVDPSRKKNTICFPNWFVCCEDSFTLKNEIICSIY